MSRFDYDGDGGTISPELWEAITRRSLRSRRGLKWLLETEAALLDLPNKRLIAGELVNETGDVCAVGAVVNRHIVQKGAIRLWNRNYGSLEELRPDLSHGSFETAEIGETAGMAFVMAHHLEWLNDENYEWRDERSRTDSGRYEFMLSEVRRLIAENPYRKGAAA